MGVGDRIRQRRKALKMSADELGARIGKDRSTVFRYEKGDIENLPIDLLEPIANILQTTPQYLMGWEEVQKNNDIITDAVIKMRTDAEFFSLVECLMKLDSEKQSAIKQMALALQK